MLEIIYLDAPERQANNYQLIAITSANSIPYLLSKPEYATIPLVAVGTYTANKAREAGLNVVATANDSVVDMAEHIKRFYPADIYRNILYPAAEVTSRDLSQLLSTHNITKVNVYQAKPIIAFSQELEHIITTNQLAAASFMSKKAFETFANIIEQNGWQEYYHSIKIIGRNT